MPGAFLGIGSVKGMGDRILAIDWRKQAVYGAVLHRRGRKGFRVASRARVPIDSSADGLGEALSASFERLLQRLSEQTALTGIACSIVVPTAWFQFQGIHLPFRKRQEIESVLPFEMAPHLVGAVDEMALSFDTTDADGDDGSRILAAATPKTWINTLAAVAAAYRIQIRHIVPAADALGRVIAGCNLDAPGKHVLLVLVEGSEDVSLVGMSKGHVRFIRCLPIATGALIDSDREDRHRLEVEIRRTFVSENEREGEGFEPEAAVVLVETDGPSWKAPEEAASLDIGVPVPPMTSRWCSDLPDGTTLEDWLWFRMHDAAPGGEGIDVHPESRRLRSFWNGHRNRILWTAALTGLCLVLTLGSLGMDILLSTRQVRALDRTIAAHFREVFPPEVPMVDPVQQVRIRNRELAEDPLMAFSGNPTGTIDALMALSRDVMGNLDVVLSRLSIEGEKLSIGGNAAEFESVYEMKRRFEKPGAQTTATIQSATQDATLNRVVFSMDIARFRP